MSLVNFSIKGEYGNESYLLTTHSFSIQKLVCCNSPGLGVNAELLLMVGDCFVGDLRTEAVSDLGVDTDVTICGGNYEHCGANWRIFKYLGEK